LPHLFDLKQLREFLSTREPRGYRSFLVTALAQTLLPEPHETSEMKAVHEILQAYQATYLENEIRRENLVSDISLFERFLALAASEDAAVVNHLSKAKALGVSPNTVKAYYGILEDTFVCRTIGAYSKSLRVQISKSPKVYFSDTGLARFVSGERGLPPAQSSKLGLLVEGYVVNEIAKQIEYASLPWRLSYLRAKSGMEVDLIITAGSEGIAAEIKASTQLSREDWRHIRSLMEMDKGIRYGIIFSFCPAPIELEKGIYNFPIWNL